MKLASLWGGHGYIERTTKSDGTTFITKVIDSPPSEKLGDIRKQRSYLNEARFYGKYATELSKARVRVPKPFSVRTEPAVRIEMEDISLEFPKQPTCLDEDSTLLVLEWLARFHSFFWRKPHELSPQGSYWYLDTRQDEYHTMNDQALKRLARDVDERLKQDRFACTVIHGDMKAANIQLSEDNERVVVYDFQYTGTGVPGKDLAKFLHTSVEGQVLETKELELVQYYFTKLSESIEHERLEFRQFCDSYELALLDWVRFQSGWGFWGSNLDYTKARVAKLVDETTRAGGVQSKYPI